MSIASPSLRSSSTTAPRPSFSNWLTCIVALPSTALTVTGMSYTASSSRTPRGELVSAFEPVPSASSASSISAAIVRLPDRREYLQYLLPERRDVSRGRAVAPGNAHVAWRHLLTGDHLHVRRKIWIEPCNLFRHRMRSPRIAAHDDRR